jgi:hypothetical protein
MEVLGRYEVEDYQVVLPSSAVENRQRITYYSSNGITFFRERFFGNIRVGYEASASAFTGLEWTDLKTHIVGDSIVLFDKNSPPRPLIYITLGTIESIQQSGRVVTILDSNTSPLNLEFSTEFDANQANSILNYLLENPNVSIDDIPADTEVPTIYFNDFFLDQWISLDGSTASAPFDTDMGDDFATGATLSNFGGNISKQEIIDFAILKVEDNRDGLMSIQPSDLHLKDSMNFEIQEITATGQYIVEFKLYDAGQNQLLDTLTITVN